MHPDELDRLADRLFTAFTDWDLDAVAAMMAPDAVVVQNGRRSSFDAFRVELEAIRRLIGEHRYEDVRRVIGDHAVVEEHAVRATAPTGREIDLKACVVIRFDETGLITSLDEYVDTAGLG
ncbi:MAG TPA: nuclear transport factor 2 family protein [Ilumatobacter sp.]